MILSKCLAFDYKKILFILGIHIYVINAQGQSLKLQGYVYANGKPLEEVTIKVKLTDTIFYLMSDKKGFFHKKAFNTQSQKVNLQIAQFGYKRLDTTILQFADLPVLTFNLLDSNAVLNAVTVISTSTKTEVNRLTYRLDPKKYIENTDVTVALGEIPDLSIISGNIKYENRKDVILFVDDVETDFRNLQQIKVEDVAKIEIEPNPPSTYGGDAPISILRIYTKKDKKAFIKGDIGLFKGVRLNQEGITPSFKLKLSKILFQTLGSYTTNNQNIDQQIRQITDGDTTDQSSFRKVKGWQFFSSSSLKIDLNKKSDLVLSATTFNYKFKGNQTGVISSTSNGLQSIMQQFAVSDTESLAKWNISANYNYAFSKDKKIFIKSKYFDYNNQNFSLYSALGSEYSFPVTITKTKELSSELIYNKSYSDKSVRSLSFGLKNINRKFIFQSSDYNINQYVTSAYMSVEANVSKQLSSEFNLLGELTDNNGNNITKSYFNFLPTASLLYKLKDDGLSLGFDYARRITRPGGNYLNPETIFFSPTYSLKGNTSLSAQIRNSYELNLNDKVSKKTSLSGHLYFEKGKNFIGETFIKQDDTIVTTYNNLGLYNLFGGSIGIRTSLFGKISLNVSSGLSSVRYGSKSDTALLQKNGGLSFTSNFFTYMKVNKIIALSLYGHVTTPTYTLKTKSLAIPYLGLKASSLLLKNKLNLSLDYTDMFGLSKLSKNYSNGINFYQYSKVINNTSNLTVTVHYYFGKTINERIQDNSIENNDIITK